MSKIWFTSDPHFGHKNILKYSKRPFDTIQEHDEALIANWNSVVRPDDTIYLLGDVSFHDNDRTRKILQRLMGHKHLIRGNHDKKRMKGDLLGFFAWVGDYKEVTIDEQFIVLCHYAFETWNRSHRGSWSLHGHSHGTLPSAEWQRRVDVGVDVWNYFPVSFEQLKSHMKNKTFKAVDHHEQR